MSEKVSFTSFESSGGARIHRIPLEVFPNFWAYAYLILKNEYVILVDCGSGTETSHENLLDGLTRVGLRPADLTHVLLTHAHIDHYGGLTQLKTLTSAKIGCHELDVPTVSEHDQQSALIEQRIASFLTGAGLAVDVLDPLIDSYHLTKSLYRSVPVDITYEAENLQVGPLEMIHLPGHCAGHVAMCVDDIVLCGDMVVDGVTPHLLPQSIRPHNGLGHYLESLDKLFAWSKDARLILNGHNDVIENLSEKIQATHANLIRRMSKAISALYKPLSTAEVCEAVYGKTSGYSQLLIMEKTGAYIEYFCAHGMVEMANTNELENGKPARYRRKTDEKQALDELTRIVKRGMN